MSTETSKYTYRTPIADVEAIKNAIVYKMIFTVGTDPRDARARNWMSAVSHVVRDLLAESWLKTRRELNEHGQRTVYYLSMEYLMGRTLSNAMIAKDVYELVAEALAQLGLQLEDIIAEEADPGLGNGGLGRLAACFLDSMATLQIPAVGYGIHYEYGMFKQEIVNGAQVEKPDTWLEQGTPWRFVRPSKRFCIRFGGHVHYEGKKARWCDGEEIVALGYDQIIPGYDTQHANTLRLWSAHASDVFSLSEFNKGDYFAAIEARTLSENVSRVLYPDDSTASGRELRLRQEYFLVSASLQDILLRQKRVHGSVDNLHKHIAIHLNDTHPALAIPEMLRLLIDDEQLSWQQAWKMTQQIFSYTNHTLMSEALESWPVDMLGRILPRHLGIIFKINDSFLQHVRQCFPDDHELIKRVSIVDEYGDRKVRMAWLSVIGSHKVNGVAKIHSQLMQQSIFQDFARIYPERFTNVTNGITPRRWMAVANRELAKIIDRRINRNWRRHLPDLARLKEWRDDKTFHEEVAFAKQHNKERLAKYIAKEMGINLNCDAIFDVQIKRIHEYKRQLLNVMHIVYRYNQIIAAPDNDWQPRVFILAGKAASAYNMAKKTIQLINDVANFINCDARVNELIKVVFIPNYGVSLAQLIIPATDLSEQISLAGTEASGTSNMKFALNGALTIGTLDGANVEILNAVGEENIFIFGNNVEQVKQLRQEGYSPHKYLENNPHLQLITQQIGGGFFTPNDPRRHIDTLQSHIDYYQLFADFDSYINAQQKVDLHYRRKDAWLRSAVENIVNMGYFSSDRAIAEYAQHIWNIRAINDVQSFFGREQSGRDISYFLEK